MDWFDSAEARLANWKTRENGARDYRKTFTPVAQKALDLALAEGRAQSFSAIGAEHLLLGLLQLREGPLPAVLAELGLNRESVRAEFEQVLGRLPAKWVPEQLPFTPRMKCILRTARREAEAQGHSLVDGEHLLLGLLAEKEGLPADLLRKLGIDTEALRNRLLAGHR